MQSRIVSGFLLGYGQPGNCPTAQLILSLTSRLRAWYDKHVRNYAPTLFGAFSFLAQASLPVAPFVSVFLSAVAVLGYLCALTLVSLDGRLRALKDLAAVKLLSCSGGSLDPCSWFSSLIAPCSFCRSKDRPLQRRSPTAGKTPVRL